ncbi:response regulator transcription factor [Clostridium folliculivorans]|uniref:Stage 0 sporulation protein A homolog n=1 Tax=Clostridium folliculivorans TaxID=2886038 RepID=A0A9W5Y0R9_9CLOT|nr:response regulator transcription factor [Clostridium folliculivorans]GKU24591.1 DNA-binding response regulator [Clostridium folliculivorans]GKU30689.1 DNA-binding response regulator [Clostridium folliculivorans]
MTKVLIIEDETEIVSFLKPELTYEGYEVDWELDGRTGFEKIQSGNYDIILLDIMLPGLNGIEVLRRVRKTSNIPIIMLTARDQVSDKVTGLDNGANDYLTKPFAIEELLARIRSALRINSINIEKDENRILSFRDIDLNQGLCEIRKGNKHIELTKKEYQLLEFLVKNKGKVLTRDHILNSVWGYEYVGDTNVVDVYVSYLRNKLEDSVGDKYITTIRGVGYVMKENS